MRFSVPTPIKIGLVVLGTTGLYTYIGQLVPQKEVLPPPAETVISADLTPEQLVDVGRQVAENKGICLTCHTIGQSGSGLRFPDLAGVGARAESRVPGMDGVAYLAQSLYEPDTFVVPGFAKGMPAISKPPIGLTHDEIKAVVAWLQSMGGTPTVTLATDLGYGG